MSLNTSSQLKIDQYPDDIEARSFCDDFISGSSPKFILGTNEYAASVANKVDVNGFIDEFTNEKEFLNKPIIKNLCSLPNQSIVLSAVVLAKPQYVLKKLCDLGIRHLDYFRFKKYSGLNIEQVQSHFCDDFPIDFNSHRTNYEKVYDLLEDVESKQVMSKIINFRLSCNLKYMQVFTYAPDKQYFEPFLDLKPINEVFIDVGSFDGFSSLEFIKRCPNYDAIHIFEPEPQNMRAIKKRLQNIPRTFYYDFGLSNQSQILSFNAQGSASRLSKDGNIEIKVKRLDDVIHSPFSYLKMDIEGGELFAIEGATQSIIDYAPRIAVSVYHLVNDLWRIPEKILSIRDDYKLYLRHYTEGVTETVMYFVPK